MFHKNGWYAPLDGDGLSPTIRRNVMSVATFGAKTYIVPLVTEWQVLYYRKDRAPAGRSSRCRPDLRPNSKPRPRSSTFRRRRRHRLARQGCRRRHPALQLCLQLSAAAISTRARPSSTPSPRSTPSRYLRPAPRQLRGPRGVTSMSWENIMPLFQAGKVAMWTDASVFYGQIVDPAKTQVRRRQCRHRQLPGRAEDEHPVVIVCSWGIAMAKQSKNKDARDEASCKWATSKELADQGACSNNITMARSSVWEDKHDPGDGQPRTWSKPGPMRPRTATRSTVRT